MWFTEKILALMNIPCLLPKHIQGQSRYTCDVCNYDFEYPNFLKLHLALRCNHIGKEFLWERLARDFYCYKELPLNLDMIFFPSHIPLPPLPPLPAIAFPNFDLNLPTSPQQSPPENYSLGRFPTETYPVIPHTQIETVYSNMGKTKKGHVCGFCGKIYSRKYGLKIHIRQVFFHIT